MANFKTYQQQVVGASYVCKLIKSDFDFDSKYIRGAIKQYIEFDNSISSYQLFTIVIFYIALGIGLSRNSNRPFINSIATY